MGMGAWYNPVYNDYEMLSSIQFHQDSIVKKDVQVELGVEDHPAIISLMNEYENWDAGEFEQKARIMGLLAGLMRIREYTNPNIISVELYDDGNVKTKLNRLRQFVGPKNLETKKSYSGEYMVGRNPLANMFYTSLTGEGKLQITAFKENNGEVEIGTQQTFTDYDDFINNTMLENKKIIQEGIMADKELGKILEECVEMTESVRNDLYYVSQTSKMIKDKHTQEKPDPNRRYNGLDHFLENMNKIDMFRDQLMNESVLEEDMSLSRVFDLTVKQKDIVWATISAYRDKYDEKVNRERTKILGETLQYLGYGFQKVDGYWLEPGSSTGKEKSFFVSKRVSNRGESNKFIRDMKLLIKEGVELPDIEKMKQYVDYGYMTDDETGRNVKDYGFDQMAVGMKDDPEENNFVLYFSDGDKYDLGPVKFYSDIEGSLEKISKRRRNQLAKDAGGIGYTKPDPGQKGGFRAGEIWDPKKLEKITRGKIERGGEPTQ